MVAALSVWFSRVYALTKPAQGIHRTVGVVGVSESGETMARLAKQDSVLISTLGRSVATALDVFLDDRLRSAGGSARERLGVVAGQEHFRLQLGAAERAALDDLRRAIDALFAVEVAREGNLGVLRALGVLPVPPRLLNAWAVLELLGALPYIATKTKLQKMLFALEKSLELAGLTAPRFRFIRYIYGPYSSRVDNIVRELARTSLVKVSRVGSSSRFEITGRGNLAVQRLRALAPHYDHFATRALLVAERLGPVRWERVKKETYADSLVRGRSMNDALLPLDPRLYDTPGLIRNPASPGVEGAVTSGAAAALLG